jgi:hypothetical protein
MKYLLALLATVTITSAQNVVSTFVSGSCDTVALMVPMASTKATVRDFMKLKGLAIQKAKPDIESYADGQVNLMVVVQYKKGLVSSVFLYLRYEVATEAAEAAELVNQTIFDNHGEADPKTDYYIRKCFNATYALRATTTDMAKGHYLVLAMIQLTEGQ